MSIITAMTKPEQDREGERKWPPGMVKSERDREGERKWAAAQLEWLRTAPPPADYAAPVFENEEEITHPPGERAILPFRMLSPGHADYLVFIDRWLARYKKQSQKEKGRE